MTLLLYLLFIAVIRTMIIRSSRPGIKLSLAIVSTVASLFVATYIWGLSSLDLGISIDSTDIIMSILLICGVYGIGLTVGRYLLVRLKISRVVADVPIVRNMNYKLLVELPFQTVLFEEVVFRGVLLAYFEHSFGFSQGTVLSSLLFGAWHLVRDGRHKKSIWLRCLEFVATMVAGLIFCGLRDVSGSLLVPMAAHYAINSVGVLLARRFRTVAKQGDTIYAEEDNPKKER